MTNDNVQHGIDDDPNHDASKGAKLGGVGGAVTGALAGSMAGPVGTVVGAIVGGIAGAVGSGAAVAVVDTFDNDDNITGVGGGTNYKDDHHRSDYDTNYGTSGRTFETYQPAYRYGADLNRDTRYTGGYDHDETSVRSDFETRYPTHRYDDYKGAIRSGYQSGGTGFQQGQGTAVGAGTAAETALGGNGIDGVQTGGRAIDGTPDTRGITEKAADVLTGDRRDDKTGKTI